MKTFCLDSQSDWDDGIYMLLFAEQESLDFSPFELVFGHSVGQKNAFVKILLLVF
jgi:hypothetical protein